ncbi:MAG TPA: hypothetical protein VK473_02915 [Terriglobales bacterium]|nr:hypothetical protein [Terriglobales bacterium]
MERVRFIDHLGQRILLIDHTATDAQEVMAVSDHASGLIRKEPLGSVLLLSDFSQATLNREVVEHIKVLTARNRPHLKRSAWVITDNLPKALYDSIRTFSAREIPLFQTREKAMEFLVHQDR